MCVFDAVVAAAIHPDPARRQATASLLKRQLEEIRDTRPRYAGAPLVTRTIRAGDALWTAGGRATASQRDSAPC